MPVAAPVYVRNTEDGPTIMSADAKGSQYVEWAGRGDPMGNDVQIVPEDYLQNVNFVRAVQRGILVIDNEEDNPEVVESIKKQNDAWQARRIAAQKASKASLDQEANNDLIAVPCIGPSGRATGFCGNEVPVKDRQKNERPPLCSIHADLAPEFVPEDTTENGLNVRKWLRAGIAPRERQTS